MFYGIVIIDSRENILLSEIWDPTVSLNGYAISIRKTIIYVSLRWHLILTDDIKY